VACDLRERWRAGGDRTFLVERHTQSPEHRRIVETWFGVEEDYAHYLAWKYSCEATGGTYYVVEIEPPLV